MVRASYTYPFGMFSHYMSLVERGQRPKRRAPVYHSPQINGKTGTQHPHLREAQRRIRQQERAAWREMERKV